jgi:hypothetical protein
MKSKTVKKYLIGLLSCLALLIVTAGVTQAQPRWHIIGNYLNGEKEAADWATTYPNEKE